MICNQKSVEVEDDTHLHHQVRWRKLHHPRACVGLWLIIVGFPQGHISDGFSHAEAPYCSPLASQASVWLSSQTAEEAGLSRTSTCGTATHHDRVYADQAEPAQTAAL